MGRIPPINRRAASAWALAALACISILAIAAACTVGSASIRLSAVFRALYERVTGAACSDETAALILFRIRMPRAILAYAVGAALSLSGACMQGIFKNPMADPHILGVSSGAALGAAFAIVFGWQLSVLGLGAVSIAAFVGAALAVALVVSLAGRAGTVGILLSGIAVGSFLTALLSGMLIMNRDSMENVYLWTMGSFTAASWNKVWLALPVTALGALLIQPFARDLNAMLLGESDARSLGIPVEKVRIIVLALTTLVTATAVSLCGIVGFVGLMVPHAVRLVTGPDHRALLPASLLAGGLFLLIMDTLARTVAMPFEIPVGVLTSLLGGPFFLVLLRRHRHAGS